MTHNHPIPLPTSCPLQHAQAPRTKDGYTQPIDTSCPTSSSTFTTTTTHYHYHHQHHNTAPKQASSSSCSLPRRSGDRFPTTVTSSIDHVVDQVPDQLGCFRPPSSSHSTATWSFDGVPPRRLASVSSHRGLYRHTGDAWCSHFALNQTGQASHRRVRLHQRSISYRITLCLRRDCAQSASRLCLVTGLATLWPTPWNHFPSRPQQIGHHAGSSTVAANCHRQGRCFRCLYGVLVTSITTATRAIEPMIA